MRIELSRRERVADWFGLSRAAVGVLAVIACLGLSEEIWSNFLSLYFRDIASANENAVKAVITAALFTGLSSAGRNLLEGFGYIIGGSLAHRMGPRLALAVSALPMAIGVSMMLLTRNFWVVSAAAVLMSNWEPLSVPATFDVVGSEVPKNRRTIAFALQSIQKRVPKTIGPLVGAAMFAATGFWLNLTTALALVALALVLQLALTSRMRPKKEPVHVPIREIMRTMPPDLKRLLRAEIFIRWGDWFARDFGFLYVATTLISQHGWNKTSADEIVGTLGALMGATALATYIPVAKLVDRSTSPRPFIGLTFFLFSLFPISLVLLPRAAVAMGLPAIVGFVMTYILNGLREIGEPARKALITTGFAPEIRARAVGVYWGVRSFAFFPAPIIAALLWSKIGPDATFLIGGGIGLVGTALFVLRRQPGTLNPAP